LNGRMVAKIGGLSIPREKKEVTKGKKGNEFRLVSQRGRTNMRGRESKRGL